MYPDVSNFQKERKLVCSVNYSHQIPMEKLLANFIFRLLSLSQESRQKIGLAELGFNGLVETDLFHFILAIFTFLRLKVLKIQKALLKVIC